MTCRYLRGNNDNSWLNSLKVKKRCFNTSFLISFGIGYMGPHFMKGKEIMSSHNSLQPECNTTCKPHAEQMSISAKSA